MRSQFAAAAAWLVPLVLVGPASSSAEVLFDPPTYVEGWALPSGSDDTYIAAIAPSQDGSLWVIEASSNRLLRLRDGSFEDVGPLPPHNGWDVRLVERNDGRLCLVQQYGAWILEADASVMGQWTSPGWTSWDADRDGNVYGLRPNAPLNSYVVDVYDPAGALVDSRTSTAGIATSVAAGPDGRVFVLVQGVDEEWNYAQHVDVWSQTGDLVESWPLEVTGWSLGSRLLAMPSGSLYLFPDDPAGGYNTIESYGPEGVRLAWWHWHDPAPDAGDGCRWPPIIATEDGEGRLLVATQSACGVPSRIESYAPLGPGLIVQPDKDDVTYSVDGSAFTGRQRFLWASGSTHTVSVPLSTPVAPGTRRDFMSWSDAGAATHDLVVPSAGGGERLRLQTFHFVTTSVESPGQITPPSAWFAEGATATLSATPAPGYRFVKWQPPDRTGWDGSVLNAQWEFPVTGPVSWKAHFIREGLALTISASETDPWVNRAEPTHAPRRLYLWAAYLDRGISALEADVSGSLAPMVFTPAEGVFNLGVGANLLCGIAGCPVGADAPRLLGYWTVMDDGGDLCLAPSAANDVLVLVQCPNEIVVAFDDFRVVGFSSIGAPCDLGREFYSRVLANRDHDLAPDPAQAVTSPELRLALPGVSRGTADLAFELPARGAARLRLVDVRGRLVRSLVDGELPGGAQRMTWDARDSAGRVVPAGVYFVRLEWQGRVRTEKLVYLGR